MSAGLVFVVNGEEVPARAGAVTLHDAVVGALEDSCNTGRPADEWELRYGSGHLVGDLSYPLDSYRFEPYAHLYLTLRLGVGGAEQLAMLQRPVVHLQCEPLTWCLDENEQLVGPFAADGSPR